MKRSVLGHQASPEHGLIYFMARSNWSFNGINLQQMTVVTLFKLIELFSSNSKKIQRNIALYVFKAFKVKEQYIFV